MTDKELRKLRRSDLIEILYYLSKENDELREENEKLQARIDAFTLQAAFAQPAASAAVLHSFSRNGKYRGRKKK